MKSIYFTVPFTNLVRKTHNVTQLSYTKDWLKTVVYFLIRTHHNIIKDANKFLLTCRKKETGG